MDKTRVLVCSAWPYASGVPHLGNLIGSLLSGDVFARYYRLRGHDVLYVSGTDAHGTRIEFEARRQGVTPAELAQRNHDKILAILEGFGVEFDNYTTTESSVHKEFVREIYLRMEENGYIFTRTEQRAFCRRCGKFLADRLISGICPHCGSPNAMGNQCDACGSILEPEELVDPICSFCSGTEIEFRETRHWYLDLARLSEPLQAYVASRLFQGNVQLFTQRMISDGLRPRAMTRDIEWGIPAPFHGAEGKVIYVWGEAALGYVSAVVEHFRGDPGWRDFWFGEDVYQIYTMAKDNIPFHTLIFPGQLIASGQAYHLPDQIAATEYLNWIGGESFSKSRGVGLYCDEALGVLDGEMWRFYLLYNRPEGRDVSFSWEELEKAINGVFISNVANLFNRVLSFVQTQLGGVVPQTALDPEVREQLGAAVARYEKAVSDGLLSQALRAVCDLAVFGNEYFQRKKPWETNDSAAVASAVHLIKGMAVLLNPFVPRFSYAVLSVMGIEAPTWDHIERTLAGKKLGDERVLLERIEMDRVRSLAGDGGTDTVARPGVISFPEFQRVDVRVGVIRSVAAVPGADRLYRMTIDLGDDVRTCVAGIRGSYSSDELIGRQVAVVANLEPVEIRGVRSECMLLAAGGERPSLIVPDREVEPGTPVV